MDRFAAADLLREVISERLGSVEQAVAPRRALRYDRAPYFRSEHYPAEIDHLGVARSPAYHQRVRDQRLRREALLTRKEQVFWSERFATLEDLRAAVREFATTSSEHWVLERHGHRSPTEARQELLTRMLPLIRVFTQTSGAPGRGRGRLKLAAPSISRSG